MKILALDTAGDWCSAALWQDGEVSGRECRTERGHGGQVLGLIDTVLREAGIALGVLDAIAFGRGPGAFTGLRLAASVTQGLAFAAGLPVIPVSNLRALAQQLLVPRQERSRFSCVMTPAWVRCTGPDFAPSMDLPSLTPAENVAEAREYAGGRRCMDRRRSGLRRRLWF